VRNEDQSILGDNVVGNRSGISTLWKASDKKSYDMSPAVGADLTTNYTCDAAFLNLSFFFLGEPYAIMIGNRNTVDPLTSTIPDQGFHCKETVI
jgi:hypothetical protein